MLDLLQNCSKTIASTTGEAVPHSVFPSAKLQSIALQQTYKKEKIILLFKEKESTPIVKIAI